MTRTSRLVATGSYTGDRGAGTGVSVWSWDPTGTGVAVVAEYPVDSPSWVGWHPWLPVLYAVLEADPSELVAFAIAADGGLTEVGRCDLGGVHGCHLEFTADAAHAVAVNYTSGSIAVVALDVQGVPIKRTELAQQHGCGPDPDRQTSAHPHQSVRLPDGSMLVADLGADRIRTMRVDSDGGLQALEQLEMPSGSGPRHIALTASAHTAYVTGELDSSVITLQRAESTGWEVTSTVSATRYPTSETNFPSHLVLTNDERFLLVANRGANVVTAFDVTGPAPRVISEVAVGDWPRHIAFVGDELVVAAQQSDRLTVVRIDPATGALTVIGSLNTGAPTCIAPRQH